MYIYTYICVYILFFLGLTQQYIYNQYTKSSTYLCDGAGFDFDLLMQLANGRLDGIVLLHVPHGGLAVVHRGSLFCTLGTLLWVG